MSICCLKFVCDVIISPLPGLCCQDCRQPGHWDTLWHPGLTPASGGESGVQIEQAGIKIGGHTLEGKNNEERHTLGSTTLACRNQAHHHNAMLQTNASKVHVMCVMMRLLISVKHKFTWNDLSFD